MSIHLLQSILRDAQRALERAELLGGDLLVAVSGGLDSVCLLHLLAALRESHGGRLEVAHVDHGLRAEGQADAAFVSNLARRAELPFHLHTLAPGTLGAADLQARARTARRGWLEALRSERGLAAVALGHHADDQVETVLFRILRGTGLRGASGMRQYTPPFVRPLLGVSRQRLEVLAEVSGWGYREDRSNRSDRYARNRLRHDVLPRLRGVHPGAEAGVLRFARLAALDEAALSGWALRFLDEHRKNEPEGSRLPVAALATLEPAVRWRVYLACWSEIGCDPGVLKLGHLETVDALLQPGRAHRQAPVPGPGEVAVSYDALWFLRPGTGEPASFSGQLASPGVLPVPNCAGRLHWCPELPHHKTWCGVPAGCFAGGLWARTWRHGDRFARQGRAPRKVKDLLIELRVPRWRRRQVLLLGYGEEVFALVGPGFALGSSEAVAGCVWFAAGPALVESLPG